MLNSREVENKGLALYRAGKTGMICGLIGLGMLILSILGTMIIEKPKYVVNTLTFDFDKEYGFMYPIMFIAYFFILYGIIGIRLYFSGMHLFAIGRIASNTEKKIY